MVFVNKEELGHWVRNQQSLRYHSILSARHRIFFPGSNFSYRFLYPSRGNLILHKNIYNNIYIYILIYVYSLYSIKIMCGILCTVFAFCFFAEQCILKIIQLSTFIDAYFLLTTTEVE